MESLNQFQLSRSAVITALANTDETKWNEQPVGYSNTLHWNAGHIYITTEGFLNKADNSYEIVNPEWRAFFSKGTRPSEWSGEIPDAAGTIKALKDQSKRIENHFNGKMKNEASEQLVIRSHPMNTVDAIFQFTTWHEGLHLGTIRSLHNAMK